jgi:hypothetical protein
MKKNQNSETLEHKEFLAMDGDKKFVVFLKVVIAV